MDGDPESSVSLALGELRGALRAEADALIDSALRIHLHRLAGWRQDSEIRERLGFDRDEYRCACWLERRAGGRLRA